MQRMVQVERKDTVAIVTMNRPARRNALDSSLVSALAESLAALDADRDLRAIILTGGDHFSVGGDLDALGVGPLHMREAMQAGQRIVRLLIGSRLPSIAAVKGNAFGAGFSMAMACDFVVADAQSTFCAAFGRVGLAPDYGLLWTLPQRVPMGTTREIVMFCEPISGSRANELGLVDHVVSNDQVMVRALELGAKLAQTAPATLATTRAMLARLPMGLDQLLAWEADTQALLSGSTDFAEGIQAFRERRSANFKNL